MAIRVYLANGNDIIREGLKAILLKNPAFNICGESLNHSDVLSNIEKLKPTLLFFDMNSDMSRQLIKNINRLHFTCPKMMLIALINENDENSYGQYICMDEFSGYFNTNCKMEELFKGISVVLSGKTYIQEAIKNFVENENSETITDKYKINSLTKREIEILKQVANGMFNKEIATSLNISERTVKNHMSNIFKKIEVADRTQAAVFAIKNNLVNI